MSIGYLEWYLIAVNIAGLLAYLINQFLVDNFDVEIDLVVTIIMFAGGTVGIILGILIKRAWPQKDNMMSTVSVLCFLVIDILIYLIAKGYIAKEISVNFIRFFGNKKWLLNYLIVINLVTMIFFAADKIFAFERRSRIRVVTLLGLAFIGGGVGALAAMYIFRHKTLKDYFSVGVPLIIVMHIFLLFYLMNANL